MPSVPPRVNLFLVTIDCHHPDVNNHVLGIKSLRLLPTGQTVRGLQLKRISWRKFIDSSRARTLINLLSLIVTPASV